MRGRPTRARRRCCSSAALRARVRSMELARCRSMAVSRFATVFGMRSRRARTSRSKTSSPKALSAKLAATRTKRQLSRRYGRVGSIRSSDGARARFAAPWPYWSLVNARPVTLQHPRHSFQRSCISFGERLACSLGHLIRLIRFLARRVSSAQKGSRTGSSIGSTLSPGVGLRVSRSARPADVIKYRPAHSFSTRLSAWRRTSAQA